MRVWLARFTLFAPFTRLGWNAAREHGFSPAGQLVIAIMIGVVLVGAIETIAEHYQKKGQER